MGTSGSSNQNAANYVAYLWAEVPGFSKFGSSTGNGSSDRPFVYTGFRPAFVMTKCISRGDQWTILDSTRDSYNPETTGLVVNTTAADQTGYLTDFTSNRFKLRASSGAMNNSGDTYIYAAFAEQPFKYSRGTVTDASYSVVAMRQRPRIEHLETGKGRYDDESNHKCTVVHFHRRRNLRRSTAVG